jgi:hypothetical protein
MSQSPKERIPEEDDDTTEAPLTMAASVVLTNLPKDASKALETAGNLAVQKGTPYCHFIHTYYSGVTSTKYLLLHPPLPMPLPASSHPNTQLTPSQ